MQKIFIALLVIMVVFSCKRSSDDEAKPDVPTKGTVYPKGTPDGAMVQKTIGPEGGSFSIENGRFAITVPPGAVTAATNFSMQPVTKTLPYSTGKAYRLLPENVTFSKPVTLTLRYNQEDLKGTDVQMLFLAYQSEDGIWRYDPMTAIDEAAKTLTVQTTHFSDWGIFAEFMLVAPAKVQPGESVEVKLLSPFVVMPLPGSNEHGLAIAEVNVLANPDNIRNWTLAGEGALKPTGNKISATYTAPGKIPQRNPVRASVEVWNFIPPGEPQRRAGGKGKATIYEDIFIGEELYFKGTLNGNKFEVPSELAHFTRDNDLLILQGVLPGAQPVTFTTYLTDKIEKTYFFDLVTLPCRATAIFMEGPGVAFYHYWYPCEAPPVVAPGYVEFTRHQVSGTYEYLEGKFSCSLYREMGGCPYKRVETHVIKGEFKVRRSG